MTKKKIFIDIFYKLLNFKCLQIAQKVSIYFENIKKIQYGKRFIRIALLAKQRSIRQCRRPYVDKNKHKNQKKANAMQFLTGLSPSIRSVSFSS